MSNNLFADFPYTTAQEWLAQILKDLKDRSLSDMQWSPDADLIIKPYVHAEDASAAMPQISSFGKWQSGESLVVNDEHESNQQILEALRGGVESLHISCSATTDWATLLADVELPMIHVGLDINGSTENALRAFYKYADTKYKSGDFQITVSPSHRESPIPWVEEFPFVRAKLSAITTGRIVEDLCSTIHNTLAFADWNPERLKQCDLSISVGMHYLIEIARLRALRILWTNLASAFQFDVSPAFTIEAHTKECSPQDDPYTHMIRSTVMGLAASLGGADRIYIHPSVSTIHPESFYRHIARNIHHLLKVESKFNEMKDPVAGAYYIDTITHEIVEKTWEMLAQKMNK